MHQVRINGNRPDFRVFIDLLFGAGRDVDTDGNSFPVSSRVWTSLYIRDRESNAPCVNICACTTDPTVLEVTSEACQLEELAALYLYVFCGSSIASPKEQLSDEAVQDLRNAYAAAFRRAEEAIWHKSSNELPYPNLA
jgi:hypothetical protein